jgi:hypothetical protein
MDACKSATAHNRAHTISESHSFEEFSVLTPESVAFSSGDIPAET